MPKISFENFIKPTWDYKQSSRHRIISGFIPVISDFINGVNDNPLYPLTLAPERTIIREKADQYPIIIIGNESTNDGNIIYSTSDYYNFIDDVSETALGQLITGTGDDVYTDLIVFNNYLVKSSGQTTQFERYLSGTWTAFGSIKQNMAHKMLKFQDRFFALNSTGSLGVRNKVDVVKSDWSQATAIILKDFDDAVGLANYNDKYVLIFNVPFGAGRFDSTNVYLWNGVTGDTWDLDFVLEGSYKGNFVKNNINYVFTKKGNKLICSYFTGSGFTKVAEIQGIDLISENNKDNERRYFSIFGEYFAIASKLGTQEGILFWNPIADNSFFYPVTGLRCVYGGQDKAGGESFYFGVRNTGGSGGVYKLDLTNSTKVSSSEYDTNIIPVPPKEGEPYGKGEIKSITVFYSVKPAVNCSIGLELKGRDDEETETDQTFTATIGETTTLSTNANVLNKYAVIRPTLKPITQFTLKLTTSGSWDTKIKRVVVEYENTSIKS